MRLDGKVVLVTGAARGLGRSIVERFAREGASVALLDQPPEEGVCTDRLSRAVLELEEAGSSAIGLTADVRSSIEVQAAVERTMDVWGRIDVLCNNAGVCFAETIEEMTDESLDLVIDVNLKGAFNTVRLVAPVMKEQRSGGIINIVSAGGINPQPLVSHYAASKGGVMVATKAWAKELAGAGINVNAIAPGTVLTPMIEELAEQQGIDAESAFDQFNRNNLFQGERGRVAGEDIAGAALFLASEEARMITGQTLAVDAGFSV